MLLLCRGIGKSMFGYWLMHEYTSMEKRNIVFRKKNFMKQQRMLFCIDGVFILGDAQLARLLADPETRYCIICFHIWI